MAAAMVKTNTPGIFKRGSRYVIVYRDHDGRQRKESARTYDEARALKSRRATERADGELHAAGRQTLHAYAREWVERYQGGQRGFREQTRDDYRRLLELYALRHFPERLKLTELTPLHVARFVAWLCDEEAQGKRLSDKTIRNILCPLRACLGTARREGLIRHNPADDAQLPNRPSIDEDDDEDVRVLTREQLATFLLVVHPRHRLFFRLLASTGLRVSEAIALQWRHLHLDGSQPHVKVRRGIVRGRLGPPKSKHARRDVPLSRTVVSELRAWRGDTEWPRDDDLVFCALNGQPLHTSNLRRRVLKPAAEEAGAPWAGFHTFRHTLASLLFDRGANAVQVQKWLGHHSAAFTLATYVHLLDGDLGAPLELDAETAGVATQVATSVAFGLPEQPHGLDRDRAA